jgi:hypothetical protein
VVFSDADITSPGVWACSKSELVVDTLRAVNTIEEELFKLSTRFVLSDL